MKVWIKLLLGSVLGIILGILLPESDNLKNALAWLEQLALRIGRYALIPFLVFSLTISIYELRQDKKFWLLILKNCVLIAGLSALVIVGGALLVSVLPITRIDNFETTQTKIISYSMGSMNEIIPFNMFNVLFGEGAFLLPVCVLAFFLAIGLTYDHSYCKPVVSLIDSLSRIFYHIISFFIEILGFLLIVLAAFWTMQYREVLLKGKFNNLILILAGISAVMILVVFPLLMLIIRPKMNPWLLLFRSIGPAVTAFFSRDINFTLPVLIRHAKENFGARRRSNTVSLTLFNIFCRAGSGMVAAVALIVILKSYSSLGITMMEVFSICVSALLVSFLLANHPGNASYIALIVLCHKYEQSIESGYLLLEPVMFYLISIGVLLDAVIAVFANYVITQTSGLIEDKKTGHYI